MVSKNILLIISGSVAAYKGLELARELTKMGYKVPAILTDGGKEFITPLAISSLTGQQVYTELFSLKDEVEMGHIKLAREADLIVVAPASANLLAEMANGLARDLAGATLIAADKKILVAPAMNVKMWENPATQRNIKQLESDGVKIISPEVGSLACGEFGSGRMAEVSVILKAIENEFSAKKSLSRVKVVVTAGPTYEPLDPVRFIGNFSSGKQGYAIAESLRDSGADVTLVAGPTTLPDIAGIKTVKVTTATEMLKAVQENLPADVAIFSAAVADWKPKTKAKSKIKKGASLPQIELEENPDILKEISNLPKNKRPKLVIGFAAESENLLDNAKAKLKKKNCDIIIANDIKSGQIFGSDFTKAVIVEPANTTELAPMSKKELAEQITKIIIGRANARTSDQVGAQAARRQKGKALERKII